MSYTRCICTVKSSHGGRDNRKTKKKNLRTRRSSYCNTILLYCTIMCTHCTVQRTAACIKASSEYNNNNNTSIIDLTFSSGGNAPAFAADNRHRRLR